MVFLLCVSCRNIPIPMYCSSPVSCVTSLNELPYAFNPCLYWLFNRCPNYLLASYLCIYFWFLRVSLLTAFIIIHIIVFVVILSSCCVLYKMPCNFLSMLPGLWAETKWSIAEPGVGKGRGERRLKNIYVVCKVNIM